MKLPSDGSGKAVAGAVEFGWADEGDGGPPKPLTGRRKKAAKEMAKRKKPGTFDSMGLAPWLLRAVRRKGLRLPTPVQRRTIPLILQGLDVVAMARTGSGKTAAFVIPMLHRLGAHSARAGARALVLSPTRELALQTHRVVRELSRGSDLRAAALVGGDAMEAQFAELAANPDAIIATPGRLLHHLEEVEGLTLSSVEYAVFDEADRLFEMGFAEQVKDVLSRLRDGRQALLFTATLPRSLADFAAAGLSAPQVVRLDAERRLSPDLALGFFTVRPDDKLAALMWLITELVPRDQSTLVFVSTRHHAEFLHQLLAREGVAASVVYGAMDQSARTIHLAKFRARRVPLLITTDVAARGLDIPLIDNVINYDFPPRPELFVHRAGRAARAGRPGVALSLALREEVPYLLDLGLYLGRPLAPAPAVPDAAAVEAARAAGGLGATVVGDEATLYGSFPAAALEPLQEHLRDVVEAAPELYAMTRTLSNAYGLYLKTRPPASVQSAKRAKALVAEGAHPALLARLPQSAAAAAAAAEAEAQRAAFAQRLRAFRPSATVLEAEIAKVKPAAGGPTMQTELEAAARFKSSDVMRRIREEHARVIGKERERRAAAAGLDGAQAGGQQQQRLVGSGGGSDNDDDDDDDDSGSGYDEDSEGGSGSGSDDDEFGADDEFGGGVDDDGGDDSDGGDDDDAPAPKKQQQQGKDKDKGGSGSGKRKRKRSGKGDESAARAAAARAAAVGDGALNEGRFRDGGFFLGHKREDNAGAAGGESLGLDDAAEQLRAAVLDLTGEDADTMAAQQRRFQWDKRKKRYVQLHGAAAAAGERKGAAKTRNEAGKAVAGGKKAEEQRGALYKRWAKQNKTRIGGSGNGGDDDGARVADALAKRFDKSQRHKSWRSAFGGAAGGGGGGGSGSGGAAKRGGELRPKAQIAKERRKKGELQARMKERQKANAARAKRADKGKGGGSKGRR